MRRVFSYDRFLYVFGKGLPWVLLIATVIPVGAKLTGAGLAIQVLALIAAFFVLAQKGDRWSQEFDEAERQTRA